jgi:predicted transglutaminase-like cysteine proteinase
MNYRRALCLVSAVAAAVLLPDAAPRVSDEPFGVTGVAIESGPVWRKWTGVELDIAADVKVMAACRAGSDCPAAATAFLAIVTDAQTRRGLDQIDAVNRQINSAIHAMPDHEQWGVSDRWSSPLTTFATGLGDCEDYAIAKYVALGMVGIAKSDLRLLVVPRTVDYHVVVAARDAGRWFILDNQRSDLIADGTPGYTVRYLIDAAGVRVVKAPRLAPRPRSTATSSCHSGS